MWTEALPIGNGRLSTMICADPAIDTQIVRDLFDATARAVTILHTDDAFAAEVRAMQARSGVGVNLVWAKGKPTEQTLTAKKRRSH